MTTETVEPASYTDSAPGSVSHVGHSDMVYVKVFAALVVLTGIEVALSYSDFLGKGFIPALMVLMLVKFFLVISYFMHLKFENSRLFGRLFYIGLLLALLVYLVVFTTFRVWSN